MAQVTTATKSNKGGRLNSLYGFKVDPLKLDVMKGYLSGNGLALDIADEESAEHTAVALAAYFKATYAEKDLCECDVCLAESPETAEFCPFCGEAGIAEPSVIAGAKSEPDVSAVASKPKATQDDKPAQAATEDAPAKASPADKKTKTKEATAMTTTEKATEKKANGKHTSTVIDLAKKKGATLSTGDLDKAVAEVVSLKQATAENYWQLGKKILEINEKNLWKLRVDEEGKARYKGFDAFCHAELKMSPGHAYKLIDNAKEFTEGQVAKFGTSKLGLVLQAPKEDRAEIIEKIEKGASKREVEKVVREKRKAKGFSRPTGKGKKQPNPSKGKPAEARITVASITGRKTIKLFKKPPTKGKIDWSQLSRAKKLGDIPFGKLELANEVSIYLVVQQDAAGNLVIVADTQREAAE